MLTLEQEKWIAHLSDENKIIIVPFDPTAEEKFQKVKQRINDSIGREVPVEHRGATSLGISGQDEIDVYIPIPSARFNSLVDPLKNIFGEPKSLYPLERARFVTEENGKHIDVFLINEEHDGWKNAVKFEEYLRSHPEALEKYRQLKEDGNGLSVREYYRRKTEFINEILSEV
ncbi:MAG: GrpB family protein [Candidatus Wolfebacteria bacterium]|nr:GrpB family protein [Candidatus Wolfebacteria bacterium]